MVISQGIWKRRNSILHGGSFTHPNILVRKAKEMYELFTAANEKQGLQSEDQIDTGVILEGWRRPPPGFFKINWDVGLNVKKNRLGVGMIIRDDVGDVIAAMSLTIQTKPTPVVREAIEVFYVAEFGRDIGVKDVILEGDSLIVV